MTNKDGAFLRAFTFLRSTLSKFLTAIGFAGLMDGLVKWKSFFEIGFFEYYRAFKELVLSYIPFHAPIWMPDYLLLCSIFFTSIVAYEIQHPFVLSDAYKKALDEHDAGRQDFFGVIDARIKLMLSGTWYNIIFDLVINKVIRYILAYFFWYFYLIVQGMIEDDRYVFADGDIKYNIISNLIRRRLKRISLTRNITVTIVTSILILFLLVDFNKTFMN